MVSRKKEQKNLLFKTPVPELVHAPACTPLSKYLFARFRGVSAHTHHQATETPSSPKRSSPSGEIEGQPQP